MRENLSDSATAALDAGLPQELQLDYWDLSTEEATAIMESAWPQEELSEYTAKGYINKASFGCGIEVLFGRVIRKFGKNFQFFYQSLGHHQNISKWYSHPICNNLSLKTPKSTFLTKFSEIGHFRPNSWSINFELFLSKKNILHKKMADLGNLAGRSANVANLKMSGQNICLRKNLASRVTFSGS